MTWSTTAPLGTVSVKANKSIIGDNFTYIRAKMGSTAADTTNDDTIRDHFWDVSTNFDGRHRFINSPAYTIGGIPADPVLGAGMDGVSYIKLLTSTQSTAQQDTQPFFRNAGLVMQLLGIRAMCVFNGGGTPTQANIVYSHNMALQSAGTPGIATTGTGFFTATFENALPSENYLVLGGAIRNDTSGTELFFNVQGATTLTDVKSTTTLKFMTRDDGATAFTPKQTWFICFGG